MLKLQGIAVSAGVTIGEALVLDSEGFRIPRRFVARSAVDTELERLAHAVDVDMIGTAAAGRAHPFALLSGSRFPGP